MGDKDSKTDPQWNWLSQRYRDKFRVLFLAIEEFYDSLERDDPFCVAMTKSYDQAQRRIKS